VAFRPAARLGIRPAPDHNGEVALWELSQRFDAHTGIFKIALQKRVVR
jgi:hypothetical protein